MIRREDTIPKPVGLGFARGALVHSVRLLFGARPTLVRPMDNATASFGRFRPENRCSSSPGFQRRTMVEHATQFVPRTKLLTAHSLRVKKHQVVRQSLYVPLPGICCLSGSGLVADCFRRLPPYTYTGSERKFWTKYLIRLLSNHLQLLEIVCNTWAKFR